MREKAHWVASITWELTEYLVDGLGITDLNGHLPSTTVAFHHACHGLRLGKIETQGRSLVEAIDGVTVIDLPGADECCGFGGLFSIKMPEISGAMLNNKIHNIEAIDADTILTGDVGCITQINGGLSRRQSPRRVLHVAEFIAKALDH